MVNVAVGVLRNARAGLGQQVFPAAELQGAGGTGAHAGGSLAVFLAVVAQGALAHEGRRALPLVARHRPRTRQHAVAAAHAPVGIVGHRTVGLLLKGAHGADGGADRIPAVHTTALGEDPAQAVLGLDFGEGDQREGVGGKSRRVLVAGPPEEGGPLRLKPVPLLAGHLASATSHALGSVDQHAHRYRRIGHHPLLFSMHDAYALRRSQRKTLYSGMVVLASPTCGVSRLALSPVAMPA